MLRAITEAKPLKILSFTDLHLDDHEARYRMSMRMVEETVQEEAPDLLLFLGDLVTGGDNAGRARAWVELMDRLALPWCPILGNHEGDNPLSLLRDEMISLFRESPYCMVPEERAVLADGSEVERETNYVVPLFNGAGDMCFKLIFFDSGADMSEEERRLYGLEDAERHVYDALTPKQVAWYREQVRADDCASMVLLHIPLPEYAEAYDRGELLAGENRESVCSSLHNSGLFAAIVEEGRTVAVAAGHDHVNDSRVLYRGVQLIYNRMGGLSSYNILSKGGTEKLLQGCTVYWVDSVGELSVDDIYYEDLLPQHREEMYTVVRK